LSKNNILISDYITVNVYGSAPSVDSTAPATPVISNTDTTTASTQPTLMISAEADSTVKVFDGANLLGTATQTATAGTYSFTPSAAMLDGAHSFYVRAIDAAGNASNFSAVYNLNIYTGRDVSPPAAPVINTVNDDVPGNTGNITSGAISNDDTPTIIISAEAGSTVTIFAGSNVLGTATETGVNTGIFTLTTSVLPNGTYTVTATARDAAGNVSVVSAPFVLIVDTVNPTAGTLVITSKTDFSGTLLELSLSGQEAGSSVVYQVSANAGNTWITTNATQSKLVPGSYQYRANVIDAAGNSSFTPVVTTTVADNIAPAQPFITALVDNVDPVQGNLSDHGFTNDTAPTLTIKAEPSSTVRVYDGATLLGTATETATAGTFTYTTTILGAGSHSFTVTATDASNNTSVASNPFVVTVDTDVPTSGEISITGKDNDADNTYSLSLNGQEPNTTVAFQVSINSGTTWTSLQSASQVNLAGGRYQYRALVTDAAGNYSATSPVSTVVTDTTPIPLGANILLTHNSITGGSSTSGSIVAVAGFVSVGSGIVAFTANDASRYGNQGIAFVDGSTSTSDLLVADAATGRISLISRGIQTDNTTSAGQSVTYGGISADSRYVVFGSSAASSFGNNGIAFIDSNSKTSGTYSDLFVFDRNDGSIRLATSSDSANITISQESSFVGISADSQYLIYTTPFAQKIAGFTRPTTAVTDSTLSADLVAYNLATGKQTLLSHSAQAGNSQTLGGAVSNVKLSIDGKYVIYTAADATKFGNSGAAFIDSAKTTNDLFAVRLSDGKTTLLSHTLSSPTISAGEASTYLGQSDDGSYVFIGVNNAAAFGFSDTDATRTDVIAVRLSDGQMQLVSHGANDLMSSAATNTGFVRATSKYVYFWSEDATKLGATADGLKTGKDLYRYDLASGATILLSRNDNNATAALTGAFNTNSLVLSGDERYVSFTQNFSGTSGRFTSSIGGDAVFVIDTLSGSINLVNHSSNSSTNPSSYARLDYQAWGSGVPRVFSADNTTLVFDMGFVGWASLGIFGSGEYDRAVMGYDLATGKVRLLSHSATSENIQSAAATYLGASPDGKIVYFSAVDATKFGNAGRAFTDSSVTSKDIFAVNAATGQIQIVTGINGASLGKDATFVGISESGSVIYRTANVNGLPSPTGNISDSAQTSEDLVASRTAILDLINSGDSPGYVNRTASTVVTDIHSYVLRAVVKANQKVDLLDNGELVTQTTADANGVIGFLLTNVESGLHAYTLRDATLQGKLQIAGNANESTLYVTVNPDTTAPLLVATAPLDGSKAVPLGSNIVLTFNEVVQRGNGTISICNVDGSILMSFDAATSSALSFSGKTLTIDPATDFPHSVSLYLRMDAGAIKDLANNAHTGIGDASALNFSTPDGTAPVFTSAATVSVAENVSQLYTVSAADSIFATDGLVTYALKSGVGDASLLEFQPHTGRILLKSGSTSYAAKSSYSFAMQASDASGNMREQAITVNVDSSPTLISSNPTDNSFNFPINADLSLTFSETVSRGTGLISIYQEDGALIESFDAATSAALTYSGSQLRINPTASLENYRKYYVQISSTAVRDSIGNSFGGLQSTSALNFSTGPDDSVAPVLLSSSPADNAINVDVETNIVLTFSEAVRPGTGKINIFKTDGTLVESFNAASSNALSFSGSQLTINPTLLLASDSHYYVQISPGAVKDLVGNNYAGIQSLTELNFSTGAADTTGPSIFSSTPADNDIGVDIGSNIALTFSEVFALGTGVIRIYRVDGVLVESYDVATSPNVSISNKTLTINPTWDLDSSTSFYLKIDAGVIVDTSGNSFSGINDSTTLNFAASTETFNVAGAAKMIDKLPGTASESIGDHSTLYIRIAYSEEVTEPYILANVASDMADVARFWQENSFGQMSTSVVYTPLIVIPYAWRWMEDRNQRSGQDDMWGVSREVARALGYDNNQYDLTITASRGVPRGASVGGGNNVLIGWDGWYVIAHEGGHALGLSHANNFDGTNTNEYGNPFDNMGQGFAYGFDAQYSSLFKQQLGWLPKDTGNHNPQDIAGGTYNPSNGFYRIYALDAHNYQTDKKYGLSYAGSNSYDLEYREKIQSLESSVLVTLNNHPTIIDATPSSMNPDWDGLGDFRDSGIALGKTFKLPNTNTYVSVVSKGDGYMDVASYQGPFPNNVAPTANFTVSSGKLVTNQTIYFAANAIDLNGDDLLYCWEFGDGVKGVGANYSRKVYDTALTSLLVKLTVSDMHGGTVVKTYNLQTTNAPVPVTVGTLDAVYSPSIPQVSVVATDAFATEGRDTGAFLFTRQGGNINQNLVIKLNYDPRIAQPAGVTYDTTQAGFIDLAEDVSSSSHPTSITIPAGQASATLIIEPSDNAILEGLEQMVVSIGLDAAYTISSQNASARVTVYDNDTPVVSIKTIDALASEGAYDSGVVMVSRTGSVDDAMTVYYTVSGTAFNGTDYGLLRGYVIIPAGEKSAAITVMPVDDGVGEISETVVIALANPQGTNYNVSTSNDALVTIRDNLDIPSVSVTYSEQRDEFTDPAFIFRGVSSRTGTVTVNYTVSGTATSGVDFVPFTGSLTLPVNGVKEVSVPLNVIADSIAERVETVKLTITPSSDFSFGGEASATARIFDETNIQRVGVTLAPTNLTSGTTVCPATLALTEGAAGGFYIYRAGPSTTGALTVTYTLSGTATAGTDYTGSVTNRTVTIPDGARGVDVVVSSTDEAVAEGMETVVLTINGGTGYSLDLASAATLKIADNDASTNTVGFETCASMVQEIDGLPRQILEFRVVLNAPAAQACSVSYQAGGGSATGNQVDWGYLDASNNPISGGTLNFAVGESAKVIRVVVNNDRVREPGELAILKLVDPVGTSITANRGTYQLSIYDQFDPSAFKEERWVGSTAYTTNTWDSTLVTYTGQESLPTVRDVGENYSRRMTGSITAPTSGMYTFYLAADDQARLYLSSDSTAANKSQIALVTQATGYNTWTAQASQKSVSIYLEAGQKY
jgi:methionine-rich copper-binding protein CopC